MKMRGRISRVETEKVMHQDKKRRKRDREKERKRERERKRYSRPVVYLVGPSQSQCVD